MNAVHQIWQVAAREMRERSRSTAFRASMVMMILIVIGLAVVPAMLDKGAVKVVVGVTGTVPVALPTAIESQGTAVGVNVRIERFDSIAVGEDAVRRGDIDVLVVDAKKLEWRGRADVQVQAFVSSAIHITAIHTRAAAAGISTTELLALLTPTPVDNVELGSVAGRSAGDETAALLMTALLFIAIATYGNLVLTGVVEEKSNRVVEVLLVRMPARNLLVGKVAGIGLLGLAQFTVTAALAFVATTVVDSVNIPAVRGAVLFWVVVWFVLGYALYAMLYGALGALASRTEDAQSVAGPIIVVLLAGYFASFASVGTPDSLWAQLLSIFPPTAPMAMPSRVAMGAAQWWEPVVAVALTVAAIWGLVQLGARVYAGAILHSGPRLKMRDAWRGTPTVETMRASTDH